MKDKTVQKAPACVTEDDLREVMPDYAKWQRRLFYMNLFIADTVLLLEICVNIILSVEGKVEGGYVRQYLLYLLLPTTLNFMAVLVDYLLLKNCPKKNWLLNYTMVLTLGFMCTVVATTHYVFSITLTSFTIPVLVSVIFGNRRLSDVTALEGGCGIIIAVSWRIIDGSETVKYYVIPEMIIAMGFILLSLVSARILISLNEQQNNKLLNAIAKEKRSQEEALAANTAKSTFLANMSHEVRTPINAILGMNEMILREEKDIAIRGYSENIRIAGNSLLSLVNDVLDISKIESGKLEISENEYELSSLVSDCCNMLATRAHEKGLELRVECDGTIPQKLLGDEPHIRQVIVNLLTNAVKYTEKGTVTLAVSGEQENAVIRLRFSVLDTGIGISAEDQKRLFSQFQRFDLSRNRNIEGTGLGLALVKKLSELMKASITVYSAPGEGSEFVFEVPQKVVSSVPCGEIRIDYSGSSAADHKHSFEAPDARILVVDDLPVNQLVIINLLKDTRMQMDTADSGVKCLEAAARKHYDLILMDHMMPEMDGIETYHRLRADKMSLSCDTPVIMLTANALAGMRDEYINEGFADYISKPVRGDKLEEVISRNLPEDLVLEPQEHGEPVAQNTGEFAELLETLPQLNLSMAMQFCCNSPELYREILRDYAESGRYDDLQSAFTDKRWEDYRISAHSLKSTSKTIGLDGLSERARASEIALKNGCTEFAVIVHEELMQEYGEVLTKLKNYLDGSK